MKVLGLKPEVRMCAWTARAMICVVEAWFSCVK